MDRKQIDKMIAVALSPGAYEEEAIVALRKAREVVKKNPALAHPEPPAAPTPLPHRHQIILFSTRFQRSRSFGCPYS